MIDYYILWLYKLIKSFKKTFNSEYKSQKMKTKDAETRKTKTQEDKNLVLPKE